MAWRLELSTLARNNLDQLDPQVARRILAFLHGRVAALDDPRSIGEALKGSKLGEFWKYRTGDYRIVASIEDGALRILVVRIGNRREVLHAAYRVAHHLGGIAVEAGGDPPGGEVQDARRPVCEGEGGRPGASRFVRRSLALLRLRLGLLPSDFSVVIL